MFSTWEVPEVRRSGLIFGGFSERGGLFLVDFRSRKNSRIRKTENFKIISKDDEKCDSDFDSESQSAANFSKKIKISSSSVARKLVRFTEYFIPRNQLQSRRGGPLILAVYGLLYSIPCGVIVADFVEWNSFLATLLDLILTFFEKFAALWNSESESESFFSSDAQALFSPIFFQFFETYI